MQPRKHLYGMDEAVAGMRSEAAAGGPGRSGLEWMQPATSVPVLIIAGFLMGLVDWLLAAPSTQRGLTFVADIATGTGTAALIALLLIPVLYMLRLLLREARRPTLVIGGVLMAAGAAICVVFLPPLLELPGIADDRRAMVRSALVAAASAAILSTVWAALRTVIRPPRSASTVSTFVGGAAFLMGGLALQYVDARLYVGGYPAAHALAACGAGACHTLFVLAAFSLLEDRVPGRALVHVPVGMLVVGGALWFHADARGSDRIHVLREELYRPSHTVTRKILPHLEEWALNRMAPLPELNVGAEDDLVRLAFAASADPDVLDRLLGEARGRWNVVLITADTVRYDEVGWQSAREPSLTPRLDRLAKSSMVLTEARTPYPTSSYAYSSMFTGFYPRFTPARKPFAPSSPTFSGKLLAEVLKAKGYATWAVTAFNEAGIRSDALFGHTRPGFDVVNPAANETVLDGKEVTRDCLDLIEQRDRAQPFLLWAHYMDAHAVYRRHEGERFRFGSSPRDLYRGEIAWLDHCLEPLLDRLEEDDLAERTLIVFVSDHGESFGEHDTSFHNSNLHAEQIRVPAFVHVPRLGAGQRDRIFNLVDTTPTVLSLLGIADEEKRQGRDYSGILIPSAARGAWIDFGYSERFPRDPVPGREQERALVIDQGKVIRFAGDQSARHFDLAADPLELRNNFNPADDDQRKRLGFMESLDRRLESFFTGSGFDRDAAAAELVDAIDVLHNENPGDDLQALIVLATSLFDSDHNYLAERGSMLDASQTERLHTGLFAVATSPAQPAAVHQAAFEFLFSLPHDGLQPRMRTLLESPAKRIRHEAALWLRKQGDPSGAAMLLDSLRDPECEWNLRAAPYVAEEAGSAANIWLLPSLEADRSEPVVQALDALRVTGHVDLDVLLRQQLLEPSFGMTLPRAQVALARAASKQRGPDADALLALLAQSPTPEARRLAMKSLSLRLATAADDKLVQAASQELLAAESLQERRPAEALERFGQALAQRPGDTLLELRVARLEAELGQKAAALERLQRLAAPTSRERPWIKAAARSLKKAVTQDEGIAPQLTSLAIEGETAPEGRSLRARQRVLFARKVTLTNKGDVHLAGGRWPWNERLVWRFRNQQTGAWLADGGTRRLISNFLPAAGLAPGETLTIVALGRTPNPRGIWIPTLVLQRGSFANDNVHIVLELDPVKI